MAIVAVVVVLGAPVPVAEASAITEFRVPTRNSGPTGIAAGPDGALWFTENNGNKVGRITTAGRITEFRFPSVGGDSSPLGITAGPDGALWFTEPGEQQIGRMTTGGAVSEFNVADNPLQITAGSDGALWFNEPKVIGRMTTAGEYSEFNTRGLGLVDAITAGPDGALWFAENGLFEVGRITTAGEISQFHGAYPLTPSGEITAGPDGALWLIEGDAIARVTTDGRAQGFPLPIKGSEPIGITTGPDGAVWFTESRTSSIGRVTTAGAVTEVHLPRADSGPEDITAGPDGALWFTEPEVNKIGRLVPGRIVNVPTSFGVINVRGKVYLKAPGARAFSRLSGRRQVPLGTTVDTRRGTARICVTSSGGQKCGTFRGGSFTVSQPAPRLRHIKGHAKPGAVAEVRLVGGSPQRCSKRKPGAVRSLSFRHLWSKSSGAVFRTRGTYAAVTAGAGRWLVDDHCNSTVARVAAGRGAVVTDTVRRRNRSLKPGHRYTARPRGRR
jgi:virginiamycin B lyase